MNTEIRDMLMDCGLFDPLLPEDFHVAAGYFNISSIARDEVIFLEGDAGTFMCIIHSGQVAVQKNQPRRPAPDHRHTAQRSSLWRNGGPRRRATLGQLHGGQ